MKGAMTESPHEIVFQYIIIGFDIVGLGPSQTSYLSSNHQEINSEARIDLGKF